MPSLPRRLSARPPLRDALLVLIVTAAVAGVSFHAALVGEEARLERDLQRVADLAAGRFDAELARHRMAAEVLAQSEALVGSPDLDAVDGEARRLAAALGGQVVLAATGERVEVLLNTALPPGSALPPPVPRADVVREVAAAEARSARSGRAEISDAFVAPVTRRPVVVAAEAVTLADGREAALYVSFRVDRLSAMLAQTDLPAPGFLAIADGSRRVIARSRDVGDVLFAPIPDWFRAVTEGRDAGVAEGPPLPGRHPERFLFAFRRLAEAPGWTLAAARPVRVLDGELLRLTLPAGATLGALAVSLGLAGLAARGRRRTAARERALAGARAERDAAERADRAKSRLLSVLAHEMRTPLIAMLGSLELLRETGTGGAAARRADAALAAGRGLLRLVDDVLELARLGGGTLRLRPRPFDPAALAREVAELTGEAAARRGDRLETVLEEAEPLVGDADRIRRVLLNFVSNAIRHTEDGAVTIEMRTRPAEDGRRALEFAVRDTGRGIAEADLPRLFRDFGMLEPDREGGPAGTGLGLAICRRLAAAMGGEVTAESRLGEGSTFRLRLTLPRATAGGEAGAVAGPDAAAALTARSVLLAEDEPVIRELTRARLERAGARVVEAADGLEAVAAAGSRRFDLVLTDLSMPRMGGVEAIRRIRAEGASKGAVVLALTAHAGPAETSACLAAGADGVLGKPAGIDRIAAAFAAAFDAGDRAAGPRAGAAAAAAAEEDEDEGAFDRAALAELEADLAPEELAAAFGRFAEAAPAVWAEARDALAREADAEAAGAAHRLVGLAATLGARRLAEVLRDLEAALAAGDAPEARRLAARVERPLAEAVRAARDEARRRGPSGGRASP